MEDNLAIRAITKFIGSLIIVGALLFLPAGTLHFWRAWLFIGVLAIPMLLVGIVLYLKSPVLLAKRLNRKETEPEQKWVIGLSGMMFIGGFIVAALDFRHQWSQLPDWISIAAAVIYLIGYALFVEVMRENAYLSRIVEVQDSQKVIDTGLYAIVRHPMYSATLFLFLAMPLILGSSYAFLIFLIYPCLLVKRINSEESVLREGLLGYADYMKKVQHRLIPFVW